MLRPLFSLPIFAFRWFIYKFTKDFIYLYCIYNMDNLIPGTSYNIVLNNGINMTGMFVDYSIARDRPLIFSNVRHNGIWYAKKDTVQRQEIQSIVPERGALRVASDVERERILNRDGRLLPLGFASHVEGERILNRVPAPPSELASRVLQLEERAGALRLAAEEASERPMPLGFASRVQQFEERAGVLRLAAEEECERTLKRMIKGCGGAGGSNLECDRLLHEQVKRCDEQGKISRGFNASLNDWNSRSPTTSTYGNPARSGNVNDMCSMFDNCRAFSGSLNGSAASNSNSVVNLEEWEGPPTKAYVVPNLNPDIHASALMDTPANKVVDDAPVLRIFHTDLIDLESSMNMTPIEDGMLVATIRDERNRNRLYTPSEIQAWITVNPVNPINSSQPGASRSRREARRR
jgi:hypothetical protein